ncbi:hypothetical protein ACFQBQ_09855 [Granulicella cerasi]|uniref:ABC transporter Uup C-terminal domain-containing protein n=1 Tax=Granulicella cerasi TaxID=741063 RepID=A0ABW1Z9J4_9BACT
MIASENFEEAFPSTHEIAGSLQPVAPAAPKPQVKRLNPFKLKELENKVNALEDELGDIDARIKAAEQQQAMFTSAESAQKLAAEIASLYSQQVAKTTEWEELAQQLEEQQS